MPRSTAPKETSQQQADPTCLIGPFADVPQPKPEEIVIGSVAPKGKAVPDPTPVVSTEDDGTITIK